MLYGPRESQVKKLPWGEMAPKRAKRRRSDGSGSILDS